MRELQIREVSKGFVDLGMTEEEIAEWRRDLREGCKTSTMLDWRIGVRGSGAHKVLRIADAAAGYGAEPPDEAAVAEAEEEERLREIPDHYFELGAREIFRARGDSLVARGIIDRDLLFVKPTTAEPRTGQIVVGYLDNELIVKIWDRGKGRARRLLSANPEGNYPPIEFKLGDDRIRLRGVVVGRSGYGAPRDVL